MNKAAKEKLVVIGNGMAGAACVEEIIKLDPRRFDITVFGAEKSANYNRVLLSHLLTGEKGLNDITLHGAPWYEKNGVTLYTGAKVSAIRRKSRVIVTEDGKTAPYNKIVLATGALPVIPEIPGIDKKGVTAFRNIEDSDRIKGFLESGAGKKAAVIGGGLLGLEAAYALKRMGADVTVIHLADRLMERQLDASAALLLKEDIEKLGISVLLKAETTEVIGGESVEGLRLRDGRVVEAGLAVMSIGIRPNAALARSSGVYCEKGIVVSDTMQTYDPAIYAVGECVQHRGATFGLVASVFEQARTLASHLAGDSRLVFAAKPVSARLKVPGIDLYSAGTPDEGARSDSIEYADRGGRVYKKLIIGDGRLRGIVLYGETHDGPALFDRLLSGADISGARSRLLLGGGIQAGAGGPSIEDMPDTAIVCGCNGITKGMIVEAIEKKGLFTREDVKRETKAATSCGGCAGLVDRILEATLGADFQNTAQQGLCSCTKYTRDDIIKNIRERGLKSVKDVMETLGWVSVGCDTCRPAINYYVSMAWPASAEDDRSSRLINERLHANIQSDGTFSVIPRVYGGVITADEMKRLADAAVKYNATLIKITGGQRIGLYGIKKEDLPKVWADLYMPSGYAYGKAVRTVKTCVGSRFCRYGTQDSLSLGIMLEKRLERLWTPAKVKLGVTGCPRNCAETDIKDIGVTGVSGGFEIYAGGCGGIELSAGELLASVKSPEEAADIVSAFIQYYREDADYGERTFKWIRRRTLAAIKKTVIDDSENRKALCKRLEEALAVTCDPWTGKGAASGAALSAVAG